MACFVAGEIPFLQPQEDRLPFLPMDIDLGVEDVSAEAVLVDDLSHLDVVFVALDMLTGQIAFDGFNFFFREFQPSKCG